MTQKHQKNQKDLTSCQSVWLRGKNWIITCLAIVLVNTAYDYFSVAQAEPWLANRYAQNCAGCHSPGRLNREVKERRCTLSCQGCHVNPNGGGIRNLYGIWNQNRFLKSIDTQAYINQKIPAPIYRQTYAEKFLPRLKDVPDDDPYAQPPYRNEDDGAQLDPHLTIDEIHTEQAQIEEEFRDYEMAPDNDSYQDGERDTRPRRQIRRRLRRPDDQALPLIDPRRPPPQLRRKERPEIAQNLVPPGQRRYPPLRQISGAAYEEKDFDRWTDRNWELTQESEEQQLSRIPKVDPLHQERVKRVSAGGDLRYLVIANLADTELQEDNFYNFLMSVDFGSRLRPIRRHWQLVAEARYLNQPTQSGIVDSVTTEARIRSFYTMVDELPYNTYIMAGIFRPMFGNYTPDHESLAQKVSELGVRATFKAVSVGFAPNVPYFNVSYLEPLDNSNYSKEKGFVLNGGLRAVTNSASITGSYWSTSRPNLLGQSERKTMLSITGGIMLDRLLLNGEILRVQIDRDSSLDAGAVFTLDARYRVYNEIYLTANFAKSNVAVDLSEGEGTDLTFGVKAFLIAGTELEIIYANRSRRDGVTESQSTGLNIMAHLFF